MYGCNLFHSVDYFQESNNLWINGQKCDGSACCVFTYYQANHIEASTMMKGMGKMIVKEFGSELAGLMFNINHFKGNQGYRWSKTLRKFSTPEKRRMKANQAFDHNLPVIKILLQQKKDLEAKEAEGKTKKDKEERNKNKKKKNYKKQNVDDATNRNNTMTSIDIISSDEDGNINNNNNEEGGNKRKEMELVDEVSDYFLDSDEEDDSKVLEEIQAQQLAHLAQARRDNDLDSLQENSTATPKPKRVSAYDEVSDTSSLTNDSILSKETTMSDLSLNSNASTVGDKSQKSARSKYDINQGIIANMANEGIKEGMTKEQLRQQVQRYQA
jgi:hypothetical protein